MVLVRPERAKTQAANIANLASILLRRLVRGLLLRSATGRLQTHYDGVDSVLINSLLSVLSALSNTELEVGGCDIVGRMRTTSVGAVQPSSGLNKFVNRETFHLIGRTKQPASFLN